MGWGEGVVSCSPRIGILLSPGMGDSDPGWGQGDGEGDFGMSLVLD